MIVKETTKVAEDLQVLESSIKQDIPVGYLRMELSTKGLLGAPSVFHVRNFDTKEIVELSVTSDRELPLKLANILDRLIFEDDISINEFHENEVIELIVKLFALFYDRNIELSFPWDDSDITFLEESGRHSQAENLKAGVWVPKSSIDLGELEFYNVNEKTLKRVVELTSKKDGFKVKFAYPKFGDAILVKRYLDSSFKESDEGIRDILKKLEIRKRVFDEADLKGTEADSHKIPYISKEELDQYTAHETQKALFAVDLIRALHLQWFEGTDLSSVPLSEKLRYIEDPRITHGITTKIEKEFKGMKFGINPDISTTNPITNEPCTRRFLFRLVDILQTISQFESDEYDVGYE